MITLNKIFYSLGFDFRGSHKFFLFLGGGQCLSFGVSEGGLSCHHGWFMILIIKLFIH